MEQFDQRLRSYLIAWVILLAGVAGWVPAALAQGPSYRIGPDDILAISVWDQKDLDQVVFVRPDGKVSLPLVGETEAGGLTVEQLAARLTSLYSKTVRGAHVTVSVREIRSRPVFFLGGVARPGPMQLTQELTVLQALAAAGGPVATADLESAFVLRGDQRIAVNLQKLLQRGETGQNLKLLPGDTIVVPSADAVYVQGEVKTPGQVKYVSDLTIVTAIAAAGGFTPLASTRRVTIVRANGPKKETFKVNVGDILSDPEESKDVPLRPNDIIIVPQRLF
jgi:polysaccharide biosynthesis/export protein